MLMNTHEVMVLFLLEIFFYLPYLIDGIIKIIMPTKGLNSRSLNK